MGVAMTDPASPSASDIAQPAIWIGTYAGGGGDGLYALDSSAGATGPGTPYRGALNSAFGVYSPRFGLHYIVDEQDEGMLGVHYHGSTGWQCVARVTTGGAAPCHVALDQTQSLVAVANYASGSVALLRLDPTSGLPIVPPAVHANTGSGPDADRQQSPHAHWTGFSTDGSWLYATDLGTDAVLAFAYDAATGALETPHIAFAAAPGSGPRHMLIHPNYPRLAYLACEMASTLVVLDTGDDALFRHRRTLSTLPADWQGASIVAHIAANRAGDRLYVSNRGHDSIAVFALDQDGEPVLMQHMASGGASPRVLALSPDETRMTVVHERDHRVTMLAVLPDGTLAPTTVSTVIPGAAFAFSLPARSGA